MAAYDWLSAGQVRVPVLNNRSPGSKKAVADATLLPAAVSGPAGRGGNSAKSGSARQSPAAALKELSDPRLALRRGSVGCEREEPTGPAPLPSPPVRAAAAGAAMLADSLVEEFEIRDDEPWYDQQDLQQDLHLAAELGKTLLDRNTELEESLQQMYATNQEQLQEIEYLTKQVELLRQMNDQHAKVYEQLDVTARELEDANQKLVVDSRVSQQKILSLTETIEGLQTHIDDLQRQVEELKKSGRGHMNHERSEQPRSVHSFSCLKELYDLRKYFVYDHIFAEKITSMDSQLSPIEEENENLKKALTVLQAQLNLEKEKRVTMEEEYQLMVKENCDLEQRLVDKDLYRARAEELELEVAEMRQMFQSENTFVNSMENLVPESFFISFKESLEREISQSPSEDASLTVPQLDKRALKRSNSETFLSSAAGGDLLKGHEETCIRRAEAVKQRGISLLNEVDTQYNALKVKYEELLKKCQMDEDSLKHKAVQTSKPYSKDTSVGNIQSDRSATDQEHGNVELTGSPTNAIPEYKALFKEIFSCIRKTKQEIDEHRTKYKRFSSQP
ncbi:cerebellar degeneration-related protein 2 [Trachemys scripta elegans]|uniref:cerebellar degeneration-related protein 2 n=1 Tax=Trachemys scripta elegans TaxID=31138 RepID=UPI00155324C7|nr:cerebellar degeneration-related protein 2 [Trachemys scripta elegans]